MSLLASGINNNFISDNELDSNNKFLKPRLVSSRKEKASKQTEANNQTGHKQSDLEDFLAQESNEVSSDEANTKEKTTVTDAKDDNFFIPEEEVSTKKRVGVIDLDKEDKAEDMARTLFKHLDQVFGKGGAISQLSEQRQAYEESKKKKLN